MEPDGAIKRVGRPPLERDECLHGHPYVKFGRYPNGACKECIRLQGRKNYPRYLEKHRQWKLRARYGLTGADYDVLLAGQGGVCAVCGVPPKPDRFFDIDHEHDTGLVRGLVCNSCNRAIGYLRDDLSVAKALVAYLSNGRSLRTAG